MQPPTSAETEDRDTPLLFFPFLFLVGSLREQGSRVAGYNDIPLRVSTALDTSRPLTSFPFTFVFLVLRIMFTAFTNPDLICDELSDETGACRPPSSTLDDDTSPPTNRTRNRILGILGNTSDEDMRQRRLAGTGSRRMRGKRMFFGSARTQTRPIRERKTFI